MPKKKMKVAQIKAWVTGPRGGRQVWFYYYNVANGKLISKAKTQTEGITSVILLFGENIKWISYKGVMQLSEMIMLISEWTPKGRKLKAERRKAREST